MKSEQYSSLMDCLIYLDGNFSIRDIVWAKVFNRIKNHRSQGKYLSVLDINHKLSRADACLAADTIFSHSLLDKQSTTMLHIAKKPETRAFLKTELPGTSTLKQPRKHSTTDGQS